MRPEWVMVVIAALGIAGHLLLSARDRGRWEQKVENLAEEWKRIRGDVDSCQQIETCTKNMAAMNDRINNAHRRMDRQDTRLDQHEAKLSELATQVGELRGARQA